MVHCLMLHTKYDGSRPSGFKQEGCLRLQYVSQCNTCDLQDETIFTTEQQFEQNRERELVAML